MDGVFVEPNWTSSIDFEARIAAIPPGAQVRGMFLQLLLQSLPRDITSQLGGRRYLAFKNYPLREYVELLALACAQSSTPAERVRQLGRAVYPNYAETMTGTAIFAAAGHSFRRVVELCPAAYRISVERSEVTVRSITNDHAIVELRNLWNIPEYHQVGIWEGAMNVCRALGSIRVQAHGYGDVDFEIRWRNVATTRP